MPDSIGLAGRSIRRLSWLALSLLILEKSLGLALAELSANCYLLIAPRGFS
jgi:hypothetical protein